MKITVIDTATSLRNLLDHKQYTALTEQKEGLSYRINFQNLGDIPIYIENTMNATVEEGYKLNPGNEVNVISNNLHTLTFICEPLKSNNDIRIITN